MKFTILLSFICVISSFAEGYSQDSKISLDLKNVTLKEALFEIENQTELSFIYKSDLINPSQKIDLQVSNASINEVLALVFSSQNIYSEILDNSIIVLLPNDARKQQQQQQRVTGRIIDKSTGEALAGVTIQVKGTTTGTISGSDGSYSINLTADASVLVFRFVGYEPQEIDIAGRTVIDVQMSQEIIALDEVIVTGYQSIRKADLTGSVSVANIEDTRGLPTSNILKAVQGKVAGLYITGDGSPNQSTSVNIRGINTLGNTNPLYIIDGAPTTDARLFQSLDPSTIESFQILKDASAASIYGSRASNGVIIITTKSGKGGFRVDFRTSASIQNHIRRYDLANADEYGRILWMGAVNDGIEPDNSLYSYDWHLDGSIPVLDAVHPVEFIAGDPLIPSSDTDWPDEVFRTGIISNNTLSISGGTERSSTMVDLSFYTNKGMVLSTAYKQLSLRLNNSINFLNARLKIGENIQLLGSSEIPSPKDTAANIYHIANYIPPILPVYKLDGTFAGPIGAGFSDRANPVQMAEVCKDDRNNNYRVFGNVFTEITPFANLVFKSSVGLEAGLYSIKVIDPRWVSGFVNNLVNSLDLKDTRTFNWTWTNTLNYQLIKGKSRAAVLLGMEAIANTSTMNSVHREEFAVDDPNFYYVGAATGSTSVDGTGTGNKLLSYFGKADYIFADKYIISGTVRYDGSSRFGENNRFGLFPAASAGWVISNENFLSNLRAISNLKLRAGYGTVGNQEIGDYSRFQLWVPDYMGISPNWFTQLFGLYQGGTAYDLNGADNGTLPSGFRMTKSANPDLKWESTTELNIGLDFGLFGQKITGSFDFFSRETKDILTTPPYLAAQGEGASMTVNGATMENKGWEFVIGYQDKKGDFGYGITGNFSHFMDKITYLPETVVANYPGNTEKTIIGHSITSQFGYVYDGLFQNQAEVDAHAVQPGKGIGRIIFRDLNDDGIINVLDQDWLGHTNPKLIYGLNGEFSYKNLSLSVFIRGVYGVLVRDQARLEMGLLGYVNGSNKYRNLLDAWTPQNTGSTIPRVSFNNINEEQRNSDFTLVNGSYIKLQSLQLGYELPKTLLTSMKMQSARVYVLGENLILLFDRNGAKSFTGPDPETPYTNTTGYPKPIVVTFGLEVQL